MGPLEQEQETVELQEENSKHKSETRVQWVQVRVSLHLS